MDAEKATDVRITNPSYQFKNEPAERWQHGRDTRPTGVPSNKLNNVPRVYRLYLSSASGIVVGTNSMTWRLNVPQLAELKPGSTIELRQMTFTSTGASLPNILQWSIAGLPIGCFNSTGPDAVLVVDTAATFAIGTKNTYSLAGQSPLALTLTNPLSLSTSVITATAIGGTDGLLGTLSVPSLEFILREPNSMV